MSLFVTLCGVVLRGDPSLEFGGVIKREENGKSDIHRI